jgi:hypothetical protein
MLRLLLSIASGVIIGVAGTLITLNWQEEKLRFELGSPAAFGEIVYQNLRLTNDGWNPATNVKLFLSHPGASARTVQSTPAFNLNTEEPHLFGGYDRLRRGETVIVTFTFKGAPIEARMLSIKSDRSVAQPQTRGGVRLDTPSLLLGTLIGMLFAFASPRLYDLLHTLRELAFKSIKPKPPQ